MEWKKQAIPLAVILAGSVLLAFGTYQYYGVSEEEFGKELTKALLQVGTILILGQLVSTWINDRQRTREKQERDTEKLREQRSTKNDLRKDLLLRLTAAYSEAKKIRRVLHAILEADQPGTLKISRSAYDKHLRELNAVQLTLELIKREIDTSIETESDLFSRPEELRSNVDYMESYLRSLVLEYELQRRRFAGDPPSLALCELPRLEDFIGDSRKDFDRSFVQNHKLALRAIRRDLFSRDVAPDHAAAA